MCVSRLLKNRFPRKKLNCGVQNSLINRLVLSYKRVTLIIKTRILCEPEKKMSSSSDIVKALLTRIIFACHIIVTVWWVVQVTRHEKFWYLVFFDGLLCLETLFSLWFRRGQEFKWWVKAKTTIFVYDDPFYSWNFLNATLMVNKGNCDKEQWK